MRSTRTGVFRIVGRLKDMIIRGGLNIYPRELEDLLHQHPAVRATAVVGVPDERLGEEVGAAVVLEPEATVTTAELRDWVKARVAPHKYPRHIWSSTSCRRADRERSSSGRSRRPADVSARPRGLGE